MSELFEVVDEHDERLVLSASGLLHDFNEAGVLSAADVHVARRVAALVGEDDERVLLAAALATRAVRQGSVCLDLESVREVAPDLPWPRAGSWAEAVGASPLVEDGVLRREFGLLYLDRYWHQEVQVCSDLLDRLGRVPPPVAQDVLGRGLLRVFPDASYDEQRAACRSAAARWTTVLTGGPGTGKTTTVAGLLALLAEQAELSGGTLRVALTAPTGKAAARLAQAVADASALLAPEDQRRLGDLPATTLHRLLGARRDNDTRFLHHRGNRLPHDVVVVDETSMVSLTMMARLVEAVRPDARLVLVGDPDQLASVDAGAVLADLVAGLAGRPDDPVVRLTRTHRFGEGIGALAAAVRDGSADAVLAVLRAGGDVELLETDDPAPPLREHLLPPALAVRDLAEQGDAAGAVEALGRHRLLLAHRAGRFGVAHWNRQVEHWISEATGDPLYDAAYPGRPLLVTANDYGLGVYNGDTGVVVRDADGALRAVLDTAGGLRRLGLGRIGAVETMHAMTIHKSQGGQADEVTVVLPPADARLLTRELLYTAVTRARYKVRVVGTEESLRAAVSRRVQRASGLRQRLAELTPGGEGR
ncbi:MAG TPA: exodeoxyribonuclease V subunit alpha [Nocardioidaceae bacterium]|nr:exodeoxyribonuclease V subunit alpha [Nocardioidaceae bacterium]